MANTANMAMTMKRKENRLSIVPQEDSSVKTTVPLPLLFLPSALMYLQNCYLMHQESFQHARAVADVTS